MSYELAQKFANYQLPSELKLAYKAIGSLGFIKALSFAQENNITNSDIDYYMNMPPKRQEGETYEEMKIRSKFSKALLKYRPYLYDYTAYNKN